MSILDQMAKPSAFVPTTTQQYIALQLAKRLSDTENVRWYLRSLENFGEARLLEAFHSIQAVAPSDLASVFRSLFHH
jgi:hypothetical protein